MPDLSRRSLVGLGLGAFVAACSRGRAGAADTLYVGDQKGGQQALLEASANLARLPYHIVWSAFPNAAPLLEALNADAIDAGIGGDSAFVFAIGTGATIKVIEAQRYERLGPVLVVRGDSPIRAMTDIAGKRIATARGSIGHNLILAALERQGRPLDAVNLVFVSPADGQAALQSKAVDGWAIWDPQAAIAERQGARIVPGSLGIVPNYVFLFARAGAIATKRPLLADYARRLDAGWAWAGTHADAYAERLHRDTGIALDVLRTAQHRQQRVPQPIDATLIADQQKTADRFLRAGLIPAPIDVARGFDRSFG